MKIYTLLALTSVGAVNLGKHHYKWVQGVTFLQESPISDSKDDRYFEESYLRDAANKEITEVKLTKE